MKKILSLLLVISLIFGLISAFAVTANAEDLITSVSFYIAKAEIGEIPNVSLSRCDAKYGVSYTYATEFDNKQTINKGVSWYDETTNEYLNVSSDIIQENHQYTVSVRLVVKNDGKFDAAQLHESAVTATINGKPAVVKEIAGKTIWSYIMVSYTFPQEHKHFFINDGVGAPATTEEDGYINRKCLYCDETNQLEIPKIESWNTDKLRYAYTGKAVHPKLNVYDREGTKLYENVDYIINYPKDCVTEGLHMASAELIGNYSGIIDFEFNILKVDKPKLKVTTSASTVKLSWKKVSGATSYKIYQYNPKTKKYVNLTTTKSTSYTIKGRKAATTYYYLVRAYNLEIGSPYSSKDVVKAVTLCKAPAPKASVSGKTVTLKWAKVTGAKRYVVYKYNTKTKKYSALKTLTANSVKLAKQPKGKNYYLVRAFNANKAGSSYTSKNLVKAVVKK